MWVLFNKGQDSHDNVIYNISMKLDIKNGTINAIIFLILLLSFTLPAFAFPGPAGGGISNPLGDQNMSLVAFFNGIVSVLIELGTIVSVLGIMYGGFLYATAQGDEEKLGKAYKTVTWALVGTAILLGARTIMAVIAGSVSQLGTN
jgi:hypothetical protein